MRTEMVSYAVPNQITRILLSVKYGVTRARGSNPVLTPPNVASVGGTHFVHGRSRMAPRSSHLYYAGAEHVGFSPTRQTLLAPSAKRREVFGESHEV